MAYYKSSEMIKKNVESWTQNLAVDATRRRDIPIIETLSSYTNLPAKNTVYYDKVENIKSKIKRSHSKSRK